MKPSIRHSWAGPVALMLGLLLAQAVIYASTGWQDGFTNPGLGSLKRHFLRTLPWTLVLGAATGWGLEAFHQRWLGKDPGNPLSGWPIWVGLVRMFLHFPFYGFVVLLQFIYLFLSGVGKAMIGKVPGRNPQSLSKTLDFMDSTALWMLLGPMSGMTDTEGEKFTLRLNPARLLPRAPWYFPCLLALLWIWTGAEGEDTGERVNAFWLSLAGMVWLGDYLLLGWMNRPAWLGRGLGACPKTPARRAGSAGRYPARKVR